jgi:murein DD-endopeptidase MepM/ murein hydrolase activator NlpD
VAGHVYVHPLGTPTGRPPDSDLHETSGDQDFAHNMALDFMAPGGTRVLAPADGVIVKLSGHDPALGDVGGGVFGWSFYLETAFGLVYATHLGNRHVHVGQHLSAGAIIGHVGHWPGDPPRSHTHLGVTAHDHSIGSGARLVESLARAPRVAGHWPA